MGFITQELFKNKRGAEQDPISVYRKALGEMSLGVFGGWPPL
jgi:hypothetical protein